MKDLAKKLLEAHIEHELNRFKEGAFLQSTDEEVAAAIEWSKKVKLKDVMTPEQIVDLIDRKVVELPIPGGVTELVGEMSRKVLNSKHNNNSTLKDIFARKQFDDIVDKIVSLKNVRNDLIHRFLSSSAYSKLISNVLYDGIKEYLLTENVFAQKVPGVSFFIKMGKDLVNKTMPKLEESIENRLKEYTEKNISKTVQYSEKFLSEFLDETHIVDIADEIWESIANVQLSQHFKTIDSNDMEDFIIIGYEFWLHFRKTKYFKEIYKELVYYFFEKYGDKNLDIILEDIGITKEMVVNEVRELVSPIIEKAISLGYLEERIRNRLESFYLSEKTLSMI
ncbi:MAG: hypothetical protein HQK78_12910 [Desulfobacterales bacterium]|nr:hypothetical protein [Desulfobacterales bacterium]